LALERALVITDLVSEQVVAQLAHGEQLIFAGKLLIAVEEHLFSQRQSRIDKHAPTPASLKGA